MSLLPPAAGSDRTLPGTGDRSEICRGPLLFGLLALMNCGQGWPRGPFAFKSDSSQRRCRSLLRLRFNFQICFVSSFLRALPAACWRASKRARKFSDWTFFGNCAPFGAPVPNSSADETKVAVKFSKPTSSSSAKSLYLLWSSVLKLDGSRGFHYAHLCFGTCLDSSELIVFSKSMGTSSEKSNFVPTMKWSVPIISMKSLLMHEPKTCSCV